MPIQKPSILKRGDENKLRGMRRHSLSETQKAKNYESLRPGVQIPEAQKAERFDRMHFRAENGAADRRRITHASSITVPHADIWDENGKLKP